MSDYFPDDFSSSDSIVEEVRGLYANGAYADAVFCAKRNLKKTTDQVALRVLLALAQRRIGKQRVAVQDLEALSGECPGRLDVKILLGLCLRDIGRRADAADLFAQVLTLSPEDSTATYQLAVVSQELGRHAEAIPLFERYTASEMGRTHALAWSLLGISYRYAGDFEQSLDALRMAIDLNPNDIPTRNALVITLYVAGRENEALAPARIALEMKDHVATKKFAELRPLPVLRHRSVPFDARDRTKNIISFSLWGANPVYTHGAIVNAQIAPHVYPGWRCRFYCDETVPTDVRRELVRLGAEIRLVRNQKLKNLKPLWRFLVADDEGVERFICRDADSRLNAREAVAVDEWNMSGLPFHVMRDHVYHMEVMLAGMWGGVTRVLPNIKELAQIATSYRPNRWNDQEFLRDAIWPLIRDRTLVHDSIFQFRGAKDFPARCQLPGKVHVGGAIKTMPEWPIATPRIGKKA